jgi:hypothetical protein
VFDFAYLENFPAIGEFPESGKKKIRRFFMILSIWSTWTIFDVTKVIGKILLGVFPICGIVNFHFPPV